MIKAILFDFDGTLANTLPFYIQAYDITLRTLGLIKTEKEIVDSCFGKRVIDTCTLLGIPEKTDEFSELYFAAIKELFKNSKLFDDTLETLVTLHNKGIKLAIITFAYRWYIDQMMAQFKLSSIIDLVISADEVAHAKPHPEAVLTSIKNFNVSISETLVVGDSKSDILMAKAASSKSVLMFPPEYTKFYNFEDLKKTNPDYIVSNMKEILPLL